MTHLCENTITQFGFKVNKSLNIILTMFSQNDILFSKKATRKEKQMNAQKADDRKDTALKLKKIRASPEDVFKRNYLL